MDSDKEMINIPISKELEPLLKDLFEKDNISKNVQVMSSIMLFIKKRVTFARAAELSGYPLNDFGDTLNKLGIDWMEYGEQEYLDDIEVLRSFQQK
ncbi:UPF0175 family protein [Priestia megaterium]|uniref:UPF0175 family protein n=1 Tax=Priestia megaterium TaxID=1404 RepID=UPI0035E15A49